MKGLQNNKIESLKKIPAGIKASIALFLASLVSKGIAYITTPVFTRLLTTDEFGYVSKYLAWVQLFGIIAMFCLSYGVLNNGMLDHENERDDFSFSMLILSNIITLSFSGILLALYPFIKEMLGIDLPYIILMCVLFLVQPAYNFWIARQRYELKYKWSFFWSVVSAFLSPLVAIVCILINRYYGGISNLFPRIFGAEVTLILIYIGFYVYLGIKNNFVINTKYWKAAFLFNLPLIPHYLSTHLLNSSDRIMISYLVNDTATAYYSVAYSVAAVATIVWTAINGSLIPYTYEKCKKKEFSDINKVTLPLLTVFACGCFMVILLAPEVVKIMATQNYYEAIYVIPPIVGGVFFQVQYHVYANVVYYYKKPKYVMVGSVTAVVLNLVLNYIFIQRYGYIAAGYTTLLSYAVQAIIDYLALRKVSENKIYNEKYILLLSSIVVGIALLSNVIYDNAIIRYSVIGIMVFCAFLFRKKLIELFRKVM